MFWKRLNKYIYFFSLIILEFFLVTSCCAAEAFELDFPAGKPDGEGYKNGVLAGGVDGWGYLEFNGTVFHPGEDWNRGYGSADYGDPIYSLGDGTVEAAQNFGGDWGLVVLIRYENGSDFIWGQFAHLSKIDVVRKEVVKRGQQIGRIGDAGGRWASHLHFEIRKKNLSPAAWPKSWSKEKVQEYYVEPSAFIKANRPIPPPVPQKLAVSTENQNEAILAWDQAAREDFGRYDLYRSELEGGTLDSSKRELVATISEKASLLYTDTKLYSGTDYYYRLFTYYKNGQVATSNEVKISFERQSMNLTNQAGVQRYVGISDGRVYWENNVRDQASFPQRKTFYYYDLNLKSLGSLPVGDSLNRIEGPYRPQVGDKWLCYTGKRSTYGNYDIYCKDLAEGAMASDIQITKYGGNDEFPSVSEDGILVWQGYDEDQGNRKIKWTDLNKTDAFGGFEVQYLSDVAGIQSSPKVWGQKVIYVNQAAAGGEKSLLYKDIITGEEGTVATEIDDGTIDIWGDYVTYTKDSKLILAKISDPANKKEIASKGLNARMRDGKIVYAQLGADNKYYVRAYMMATEKVVTVAGPLKYQPSPYVYENMVAYDASPVDLSTDMDIYLTWL